MGKLCSSGGMGASGAKKKCTEAEELQNPWKGQKWRSSGEERIVALANMERIVPSFTPCTSFSVGID